MHTRWGRHRRKNLADRFPFCAADGSNTSVSHVIARSVWKRKLSFDGKCETSVRHSQSSCRAVVVPKRNDPINTKCEETQTKTADIQVILRSNGSVSALLSTLLPSAGFSQTLVSLLIFSHPEEKQIHRHSRIPIRGSWAQNTQRPWRKRLRTAPVCSQAFICVCHCAAAESSFGPNWTKLAWPRLLYPIIPLITEKTNPRSVCVCVCQCEYLCVRRRARGSGVCGCACGSVWACAWSGGDFRRAATSKETVHHLGAGASQHEAGSGNWLQKFTWTAWMFYSWLLDFLQQRIFFFTFSMSEWDRYGL